MKQRVWWYFIDAHNDNGVYVCVCVCVCWRYKLESESIN